MEIIRTKCTKYLDKSNKYNNTILKIEYYGRIQKISRTKSEVIVDPADL